MAATYVLIASNTVGAGGSVSVTFSSIPATYTDLLVKMSVRTASAGNVDNLYIKFNTDTGTTSSQIRLYGNGASITSDKNLSVAYTSAPFDALDAGANTANTFSNSDIYIPNYTGSTNKSFSNDAVEETNATTAYQVIQAGLWANTSAINQLTFTNSSSTNFVQYSTFYLYGIKNS